MISSIDVAANPFAANNVRALSRILLRVSCLRCFEYRIVISKLRANVLDHTIAAPTIITTSLRKDTVMSELVTYERQGRVATIVMDDAKVNLMSLAMLEALDESLNQAQWDQVVVVLSGRTDMFSAGFDLRVLRAGGTEASRMVHQGFLLAERLLSFPFPVVVACTGHALAMGAFLLLAGDYRIGAEGAFRIGVNEVAIGLTMPHFGVEICRQRLSPAHFNRAVINAEIYAPEMALAAGFLDEVVPTKELTATAQLAAARLTSLDMRAHAATKSRARHHALRAIRSAIESDENPFATRRATALSA